MARKILLGVAILVAILIFLFVCLIAFAVVFGTSISVGGTLPSGRSITASAKSFTIGIETSGNTAIVRTWGRKVEIAPAKFTIDDQFSGPLPPGAKSVNVHIDGEKVNITADGVPVTKP